MNLYFTHESRDTLKSFTLFIAAKFVAKQSPEHDNKFEIKNLKNWPSRFMFFGQRKIRSFHVDVLRYSRQTRTHCCGHIVADTNVSPFARARNICCGHKFCVRDTKNVSDFGQKHFVSATNVSQFAQHAIHHEQQCVRNNVSSFASIFTEDGKEMYREL